MLYTGKGDDGYTGIFGCDQYLSKSAKVANALGSLDETSSLLGLVGLICSRNSGSGSGGGFDFLSAIKNIQNDLFIAQAHIAGADKKIKKEQITKLEDQILKIEKILPPIKNFIIPGGSELSAALDYARSVARRAERHTVSAYEEGSLNEPENLLSYINRLSSLLYALARLANYQAGQKETSPRY
jgi:cob(I)alamin adenosyltransferase